MDKCSDCGGELEKGVLLDMTYGATLIQRYAQSDNIPTDTRNFIIGNLEANFNNLRRVVAFRCTKCNKIHTYAQDVVLTSNLKARSRTVWIVAILVAAIIIAAGFGRVFLFH